jgi:hypothetical protein
MLDGFKRLFARAVEGSSRTGADWGDQQSWAERKRFHFRPVREDGGFVVEGFSGSMPWRLEWGRAQRPYIDGNELRLRADVGPMAHDVQAMVLDRTLQSSLEHAVFEQYVDGVQTRIDSDTPPEMRWLVMHTKLGARELGALRERFAGVAMSPSWLQQWLDGPLSAALLAAPLSRDQPVALMLSRSRLSLRTALDDPDPPLFDAWLRLFGIAQREARRVADRPPEAEPSGSPSSLWAAAEAGAADGTEGDEPLPQAPDADDGDPGVERDAADAGHRGVPAGEPVDPR